MPGQRLVVRLVDRVGRIRRRQPSLRRALRRLRSYFRISVDPYSGLSGEAALTRIMVGFARPDLRGYIRGTVARRRKATDGLLRGLSDTRLSLFMPAPSRMTFPLTLPAGRRYRLSTELSVVRAGRPGPVRFILSAELPQGNRRLLLNREIAQQDRALWHPVDVDLTPYAGRSFNLVIETQGPPWAGAFFGRPEIWQLNGCRAGPNLLFVVLDTVRADVVGATGGRWNVTPVLDLLARQGTLFKRCYALATRTRPSMTAIVTAEWLAKFGLTVGWDRMSRVHRARVYPRLGPKLYTLHFRRLGYRTAAVGNNFFLVPHSYIGLDRGLDRVVDMRHRVLDAVGTTVAAERFMRANRDRPFFLWVHFDGAHQPYTPPRGYAVKGARARGAPWDRAFERYLGEVRWTDEQLGKLLEALDRLGLKDRTVIAVTADHGEVFSARHNYFLEGHHTRHHHGWSAYEEVLHVPLVFAGPGVPKGRVVERDVSHLDLMPTFADLAGLPILAASRGRSLAAWIEGRQTAPPLERPPVISQGRYQAAVREGRLKYILRWGAASRFEYRGAMRRLTDELYDLSRDPGETRNLARKRRSDVDRLRKRLFDFLWDGKPPWVRRRGRNMARRPDGKLLADPADTVHFRLWGGRNKGRNRLTVHLKTRSAPVLRSLNGSGRVDLSGKTLHGGLRLALQAGPGQIAEASVGLSSEPVEVELQLNGRPVQPGRILAGPFGLSLLNRASPLDRRLKELLAARVSPGLPGTADPRVSVWVVRRRGAFAGTPGWMLPGGGAPDGEVKELLQRWGYIHEPSR